MTYPVKSGHTISGRISDENPKIVSCVTFDNDGSSVAQASVTLPAADYPVALAIRNVMHRAATSAFLDLQKAYERIGDMAKNSLGSLAMCRFFGDTYKVVCGTTDGFSDESIRYIIEILRLDNIERLYVIQNKHEIMCFAITSDRNTLNSDKFAEISIKFEGTSKEMEYNCIAAENWQVKEGSLPQDVLVIEKRG